MLDSFFNPSYSPIYLAFLGNLIGWASTAAGAALIFPLEYLNVSDSKMQIILDAALGASVGVMIAASFFSLLAPAIEEAETLWPENPHANWMVAASGFLSGGAIMILADRYLPEDYVESFAPSTSNTTTKSNYNIGDSIHLDNDYSPGNYNEGGIGIVKKIHQDGTYDVKMVVAGTTRKNIGEKEILETETAAETVTAPKQSSTKRRTSSRGRVKKQSITPSKKTKTTTTTKTIKKARTEKDKKSWRRIVLLVIAISLHNAPEGGAVGVAFGGFTRNTNDETTGSSTTTSDLDCAAQGCAPKSKGMTFSTAKSVAIGIGLQNFPEGLAVALPLRREGCTLMTAFWWGQMSGLVEVFSGFIGAYLVQWARFCLPVALACAAGAMICK